MELATHSMVSSPNQRRLSGLVPESQPEPGQPGRDRNDLPGPPSTSTREQAPSFSYGVADPINAFTTRHCIPQFRPRQRRTPGNREMAGIKVLPCGRVRARRSRWPRRVPDPVRRFSRRRNLPFSHSFSWVVRPVFPRLRWLVPQNSRACSSNRIWRTTGYRCGTGPFPQ